MSEWIVDVQNMFNIGQIGERMFVVRMDRMTNKCEVWTAPKIITIDPGGGVGEDAIFMTSPTMTGKFGKGEIDQFLQAMMDAGWKRGLRPVGFDPSAGELAAVNRHLEDLRNLVKVKVDSIVLVGEQPKPMEWADPQDPKKW